MKRWLLFALVVVLLGSCGPTPRIIRHRSTLSLGRNFGTRIGFGIGITSDCVEPGQPLSVTLTLYNRDHRPVEILASSPLDIALVRHTTPATLVAAWSASPEYPVAIPPLEPQEIRAYTWTWTPTDAVGPLWVDVQITVQDADGKQWSFNDHTLVTGVGEGYGLLGVENMLAKCADLQPAK